MVDAESMTDRELLKFIKAEVQNDESRPAHTESAHRWTRFICKRKDCRPSGVGNASWRLNWVCQHLREYFDRGLDVQQASKLPSRNSVVAPMQRISDWKDVYDNSNKYFGFGLLWPRLERGAPSDTSSPADLWLVTSVGNIRDGTSYKFHAEIEVNAAFGVPEKTTVDSVRRLGFAELVDRFFSGEHPCRNANHPVVGSPYLNPGVRPKVSDGMHKRGAILYDVASIIAYKSCSKCREIEKKGIVLGMTDF